MSTQFESTCYTTQTDALQAACSAYNAPSFISNDGAFLISSSCTSSDNQSIFITIKKTEISSNQFTTSTVSQAPNFTECTQKNYVNASLTIFSALLTVLVSCYCLLKIKSYFDWTRNNE